MKSTLNRSRFKLIMETGSRSLLDSIINVTHPSFSIGSLELPLYGGMKVKRPGTSSDYGILLVEFVLDDLMENYETLYSWTLENYDPRNGTGKHTPEQGVLQICRDNGTVRREIKYRNLFPIDISEVVFATNEEDTDYEIATVTFLFDYFELVPLKKEESISREQT